MPASGTGASDAGSNNRNKKNNGPPRRGSARLLQFFNTSRTIDPFCTLTIHHLIERHVEAKVEFHIPPL